MINIVLILLLLQTIYNLIFKPKYDSLNCGIFAWTGRTANSFNESKFDILGIQNISRGRHSCGVSTNGEIFIGVDNYKLYSDFITKSGYDLPKQYPHAIGHTRAATSGAHTIQNAHPFGFGKYKNGYEFIGVHNGTLYNENDLAKSRNIDLHFKEKKSKAHSIVHTKIDSHILLECLYKDKDKDENDRFKVLSEYIGAAALVFTDTKEPNVIYCYHGASKKYSSDTKLTEERPLFYYQQSKYSLYISSIEESLKMIAPSEDYHKIKSFDLNTVYKIKNGNVASAEKFKIARSNVLQKQGYSYYDDYEYRSYSSQKTYLPSNKTKDDSISIYNDKTEVTSGRIYMEKLRYYRNGHLISGCWTYILGHGFYFLGKSIKDAESSFWNLINRKFLDGQFVTNFNSLSKKDKARCTTPFVSNKKSEIVRPLIYYFYKGIRLKQAIDYIACNDAENKGVPFDYDALSCCSAHPIIDIDIRKSSSNQGILLDRIPFSGIICPMDSEKVYTIKNGNLVSFSQRYDLFEEIKKEEEEIQVKNINDIVENLEREEEEKKRKENIDYDLLYKKLDEVFIESFSKFPSYIKQLKPFDNDKSKEAISILERFLHDTNRLLNLEIKE